MVCPSTVPCHFVSKRKQKVAKKFFLIYHKNLIFPSFRIRLDLEQLETWLSACNKEKQKFDKSTASTSFKFEEATNFYNRSKLSKKFLVRISDTISILNFQQFRVVSTNILVQLQLPHIFTRKVQFSVQCNF